MGLSGAAIAATSFTVTQCPKYTVLDSKFSENSYGTEDSLVYGTATADHDGTQYDLAHAGWVGVTTYIDMHGNLRVKSETLVAMSGISTGNIPYPTDV